MLQSLHVPVTPQLVVFQVRLFLKSSNDSLRRCWKLRSVGWMCFTHICQKPNILSAATKRDVKKMKMKSGQRCLGAVPYAAQILHITF